MSGSFSALRDATRHPAGLNLPAQPYVYADTTPAAAGPAETLPRVHVTGSPAWQDAAAVRVALCHAWRAFGRPIAVVQDGAPGGVAAIARDWVAEHAFAGIRLVDPDPEEGAALVLPFPAPAPRPNGGSPS